MSVVAAESRALNKAKEKEEACTAAGGIMVSYHSTR